MDAPRFDPITGLPMKAVPAPRNTRTMLYHATRDAIVVEGVGTNDAERRIDADKQIKAKQKEGYTLTRKDGQHPHSFDEHRMDQQRRDAEDGDREAAAKLNAKAVLKAAESVVAPVADVASLQAQIVAMAAQLEELSPRPPAVKA